MPRSLTQEQLSYLKEHVNDKPRKEVAKKAGVTLHTLYKYIRLFNGNIGSGIDYDELRASIRKLYVTMTASEIAKKLGLTTSQVQWQATQMELQHDKETCKRINAKRRKSLDKYWNKENYAKKGKMMRVRYKIENLRVLSGLPQTTNLRLRNLSPQALNAKKYLRKKYNYFYSDGEPFVLCYDNQTRRCKKERHYTDKFGFQFVEGLD